MALSIQVYGYLPRFLISLLKKESFKPPPLHGYPKVFTPIEFNGSQFLENDFGDAHHQCDLFLQNTDSGEEWAICGKVSLDKDIVVKSTRGDTFVQLPPIKFFKDYVVQNEPKSPEYQNHALLLNIH